MKKNIYFFKDLISQNQIINSLTHRLLLLLLLCGGSQQIFSQSICGTWSSAAAYPTNNVGNGLVTIGSNIYCFSGYNGIYTSASHKFNGTTWSSIANLPGNRYQPALVTDGTYAYIIAGSDETNAVRNTVYRYNPTTNTYSNMANIPVAVGIATAAILNNKIYVFGGCNSPACNVFVNNVQVYDIATNTWSAGPNFPNVTSNMGAVTIGSYIYLGSSSVNETKTYRFDGTTYDDAAIADLPAGRSVYAYVNYNNNFVMLGGVISNVVTNTAISWNSTTNTWSSLPNLLNATCKIGAAAVLGSSIYIAGGSTDGSFTNLLSTTQRLTTSTCPTEMNVKGNNVSIADGDTSPSTADNTDFGSVSVSSGTIVKTFTIENLGGANLTLSGSPIVAISGTNAADFTVTTQATSPVTPLGTTTFSITFDPSVIGNRTASVSIANNDSNENPYNFAIQGSGSCSVTAPTGVSVSNAAICNGSSVTLNASCSSGTVTWYSAATGGTNIGTGTGLSKSPTSNTTYYASCAISGCESSRVATSQVVVTNIPNAPTTPSVSPTTICSGSNLSLTASCTSSTVNWYTSLTGGAAIGTGSPFSQTPSSNTTYYATCKSGSCESSPRTSAGTVTVTAQPSVPTALSTNPAAICSGSSTSLSATCASGIITWYNTAAGGTSIGTGNNLSQSPTSNTTYFATCKNGNCETARTSAGTVTVTAQPSIPTALSTNPAAICSGSSTSLSATCSGTTITWYNTATGGTSIGTGNNLSQSPTSNTTYFATCKNGNCETARTSAGTVTVTAQPSVPTALSTNPAAICSGSSTSLSATCATGTITWYNTATGGTSIGTGNGFSQSPTSNTTYFATCKNGNCETARTSAGTVTVTAQPSVPTALSTNPAAICSGSSTSLSATCASGTITWYNALTGGTSIGTGNGFSQSPVSNTTYFATCKNGNCETARTSAGTVTVTAQPSVPTALSTNPAAICSGSSTSLSATCASGTITWYNALTGGTSIGTGNGFSQSPTSNTTYFATCKNGNCETTRTSAGTVTVTTQPIIPTSVSVNNTSICSGTSVSLTATCSVGTVRWYNAATGGTSLGSTSPLSQSPTVNTTYYASCRNGSCESGRVATSLVTVTDIPAIPSAASVNNTAICNGISVSLSATCLSGTITWYNTATGGTAIGTGTGLSHSPSINTTYYASCENQCGASTRRATSQVVVTNIPNVPTSVLVNNTAICNGTSISLSATCLSGTITWYNTATGGTALGTGTGLSQTPSANTTYYAVCSNNCGESSRVATNQVVVTPIPNAPTGVLVDNTSISVGNDINLSASCSSGTITWYNTATGGTAIGTGSPFNYTPTPAGLYTFYTACENGACKSSRVATANVNVNGSVPNPTGVSVSQTAICVGNSVSLTANACSIGILTWYNQATGGTAIGTDNPLIQTPSASTITYYASCKDDVNESGRVATNAVVITANPVAPTAVSASQTAICNGTSISLSATCSIGTIKWYSQLSGGTAIGTGNGFLVTPTINTSCAS